jgi:NAD(P)H-flavin reductase
VFVATGTGIAPFCSMAASGVSGFIMLHGAETPDDLYYQYVIASCARQYVPCLSGRPRDRTGVFSGRVTDYMAMHVTPGAYDFYLCGRQEMIRDATLIVDERFPGSLIYSETFY